MTSESYFPTLILRELEGGAVQGVVVVGTPFAGDTAPLLADLYAEPEEVEFAMQDFAALEVGDTFLGLRKEADINTSTVDEAMVITPESTAGQKGILLYRDSEWWHGLWNNPEKDLFSSGLSLSSVADFYGGRASHKKITSREELDEVRIRQTIHGDYKVLRKAVELANEFSDDDEMHPGVVILCDWWNSNAPETMRHAGFGRIYIWDPENKIFEPGDPEEPCMEAQAFSCSSSFALFESEGMPSVVVHFIRGRKFNVESGFGTQTYIADGTPFYEIGMDLQDVDEAYYAVIGLRTLRSIMIA